MHANVSQSALAAEGILSALFLRDAAALKLRTETADATRTDDTGEAERLELLAAIGRNLLLGSADEDVCRGLLRHLAGRPRKVVPISLAASSR